MKKGNSTVINVDDFRREPRFMTQKESRRYYDQIMDFLTDLFEQERSAMDSAMNRVQSFTKLITLCLVAVDMDVPVDIVSEVNENNLPPEFKIIGKKEEIRNEPKASVIRLRGNSGDEQSERKDTTDEGSSGQ